MGVLTQVVYPLLYPLITIDSRSNPIGVLLLAIRDVALVGCVVYAGRRTWIETAPLAREHTLEERGAADHAAPGSE